MTIKLYNTLSKKKESFYPLNKGLVNMYNCGPTVYDTPHIGNMRAYIFTDILRRYLEFNNFKVNQIINITDVGHLSNDSDEGEDKMTKALKREKKEISLKSMREIAQKYYLEFLEDLKKLNIKKPSKLPFASDHIKEMVKMIEKLIEKNIAYTTETGIYFNTLKFKDYGKLGGVKTKKIGVSRIKNISDKKNEKDFALWKFNKNIGFEASFGKGFPGWHIECSAMAIKYLGETLDIHTGGIDHIAVHHNNEIAQSESLTKKTFSNFWLHNNMININGKKMAKSDGNFSTIFELEKKGFNPLSFKYWVLTGHYRSPMDFSKESLNSSETAYKKIMSFINNNPQKKGQIIKNYLNDFIEVLNDDLNTPKAIALIWKIIKNKKEKEEDKKETILEFDKVLGLNLKQKKEHIPEEIKKMAKERELARKNKEWKKADEIRKKIEKMGFKIKDKENNFEIISSKSY